MSEYDNTTFDWDDEIEEEREFSVVPEGKYDFEVTAFERSTYDGSEKIPPCKMALVTFKLTDGSKTGFCTERYYLCKSQEWKLSSLFKACGLKKSGEKTKMQWDKLIGSKGSAKVGIRTYNDNEFNTIKNFIEPKNKEEAGEWE